MPPYPDNIHNNIKSIRLFIYALFCGIALTAYGPTTTHAQSAGVPETTTTAISYPSAVLTDLSDILSLAGHVYMVPDSSGTVTRSTIRDMIARGYLMKYRTETPLINLGSSGSSVWLVFPISSISNNENWTFSIGHFSQGRFGTLRQFEFYDLSRGKTLFSSQENQGDTLSIPEKFHVHIQAGQTTYLAAYIKTTPAALTILSPRFENQSSLSPFDALSKNMSLILGATTLLTLIVLARTNRNIAYLYLATTWAIILFHTILSQSFIYQKILSAELLTPVTWVSAIIFMILASWKTYEKDEEKPLSLYLGITGIALISGLASLVLASAMPNFSLSLEYGIPAIIGFILTYTNLKHAPRNRRFLNIAIASTAAIISLSHIIILLLASHFLPTNDTIPYLPQACISLAAFISLIAIFDTPYVSLMSAFKGKDTASSNTVRASKTTNGESSDFKDVREKSDHRRLMQVIEQERKAMSDMQIKAAQQTEEMRKSKESADEATRAKSAFLAVVSHEIRTPMTGIMGMLRLLQDTTLSKEQADYATTIKDSGDALLALLNDILDFEKIESGKMELESISFDLKRLLRGIHTLMKGHAEFKNVELVLEVDPKTPTWVIGDPTRLRQVLLNLINNAVKFTSKGIVTLRIQDLTGKSSDNQNFYNIYFAIQDSGIGISPEGQKKLFMPFAQADSSVSRKYGGTGLGLTICKRLIEAMGGNISISSKENEGSTFFFTIRMAAGAEAHDDLHQHDNNHANPIPSSKELFFHHQLNILIVDDNIINQKVVAGFLDKLGLSYATAGTGKDVLDMIEREKFSAILMDLQLPDMDGIEITKHIRDNTNNNIAQLPIIAFTGNTAQEDVETCKNVGMNDFASKPISFEKIVELMQKADGQMDFRWTITPAAIEDDGLSPLMRHRMAQEAESNKQNALSQNKPEKHDAASIDFSSIDLDEDDDSFAVAVEQFEAMEKSNTAASSNPTVKNTMGTLDEYGLDETMLKSLTNSLGVAQTVEILVSFYDKADELIAATGSAFLEGNLPNLYARSHELKGMAGNFGFSDLSRLCGLIEKAAKNSDPSSAKNEVDQLGECYSISRSQLNKWLEEQK